MSDFFSELGTLITQLQPISAPTINYAQQSQMNNTFDANPDFATKLYAAKQGQQQVNNQTALTALQQQEAQQKINQTKASQSLVSQIADPTQRLLAQLDPAGLGKYLATIQKQSAASDQAKRQAALIAGLGETPGVLSAPTSGLNAPKAGNASGAVPLNVQNNNPGNMKSSDGNFQSFSSPEEGVAAMTKDLALKLNGKSSVMIAKYGQGYTPTLNNLIPTWAPASDNNNTQAYISAVSAKTGINPNQPLGVADISKLQSAMINQEGGDAASQYFGSESNLGGQSIQPQPVDRTPLQAPDGTTTAQNFNENGAVPARQTLQAPPEMPKYLKDLKTLAIAPEATEHQQNAFIDAYKEWGANQQKTAEKALASTDPLSDDPNAPAGGPERLEYMKKVDPASAGLVQDILAGKASVGQLTSRNGQVKPIVSEVTRIDPNFDFTQYAKRQKAAIDFATGDDSKTIYNLNNAASDLVDLKTLHDNLNNGNTPVLNAIKNSTGSALGNGNPGAYTAKAQTVANELEKISSGKAATLGGSQHAESAFGVNSSNDQSAKAIQQAVDGINNRLSTLADKRDKAFGSSNYVGSLLNETTIQKLSDAGYAYDDAKGKIVPKDQISAPAGANSIAAELARRAASGG